MSQFGIARQIPRNRVPASVQLALRAADHPAAHVLDYLAKCEHAAALRNRRDLVLHYQECWRLVYERVFGLLPLPIMAPQEKPVCPPPAPRRMKGWEKQKYSKPVRRVVGRRDEVVNDDHGLFVATVTVLVLECGHEWRHYTRLDQDEKPRNRRCKECANSGFAAVVELGRVGPGVLQ